MIADRLRALTDLDATDALAPLGEVEAPPPAELVLAEALRAPTDQFADAGNMVPEDSLDRILPRRVEVLTAEEARQAGIAEWERGRINAEAGERQRQASLFAAALSGNIPDVATLRGLLPVEGARAAENAALLRELDRGLEARAAGLRADPAGFAMRVTPAVQRLGQDVMAGNTALLPVLVEETERAQRRLGVPRQAIQPLPTPIAQQLAARVMEGETTTARLQALLDLGQRLPLEEGPRIREQLGRAGVPDTLLAAAAIAPRAGQVVAARIANDLAVEADKLPYQQANRRAVQQAAQSFFRESDRLGGLREAQATATGSAEFTALAQRERALLEQVALVRGATAGDISTAQLRQIHEQLFGGQVIVNRPSQGVVVHAPAGTDAEALTGGLRRIAETRIAEALPQVSAPDREVLRRQSVWVNQADGRFALRFREANTPVLDAQGRPLVVSLPGVLDAAREARQQAVPVTREDIARRLEETEAADQARRSPPPPERRRLPITRRVEALDP